MKLSIKLANGTEQIVDVGPAGLKLAAQPGATYRLIDERTLKTPVAASVKRLKGDLRIDGGETDAGDVQITGFFDDCSPSDRCWAAFDAPVDTSAGMPTGAAGGATAGKGTVFITQDGQDGQGLVALQGGHVGGMADGQVLSFANDSHGWGLAGLGAVAGVFAGTAAGFSAVGSSLAAVTPAVVATGAVVLDAPTGADAKRPLTIKGEIAAGAVMTGTVEVSAYDQNGNLLGKSLVDSDKGTYSITIADRGGYTGPVLLVARDVNSTSGNYLDEATGKLADLGLSLGAVGVAIVATDLIIINITPITQLAVLQMGIDVNAAGATFVPPSDTALIATINAAVGKFFGLADILGAVVTINDAGFRTASVDAQAYGVALARLSHIDQTTGSSGATINWLATQLAMAGTDMASANISLDTLDTSRTVARQADLIAAEARGDVTVITHVNLLNVAMVELVFALPVNAQVGDLMHVTLAGAGGVVTANVYVVTAADLVAGYASVPVTPIQLAATGTGTVVPTAIVTDAAGENASPTISAHSFLSDVTPPDPVVTVTGAHGHVLTAADTGVEVRVAYDDAQVGDTVQLWLNGAAFGQPHVVTAAEASSGAVTLAVDRDTLGADGAKLIAVTVLDTGGNTGVAAPVALALDTDVPQPAMTIKAGQDATLSSGETRIDFEVRYAGMQAGDTVQLNVGGAAAGTSHVVTAAEVASGLVAVTLPKTMLGDAGTQAVSVVVVDGVGNAGSAPAVAVTVEPTPLTPVTPVAPIAPTPPVGPHDPLPAPPLPTVAIRAGEGSLVGGAGIDLVVSYVGASAGDSVQLSLDGVAFGAPHLVTVAEAAAGAIDLHVDSASLGADGAKHLTTQVTDGHAQTGSSAAIALTLDTLAPAPTLVIRPGETGHVGLGAAEIHLQVAFDGMSVGDVVQLRLSGMPLGEPHAVTAADLYAGSVTFDVSRDSLGADGLKLLSAVATDAAGNAGVSMALPLVVDSVAATLTIALAAGENAHIGAAQTAVHIVVSSGGLDVGDVITLQADGQLIAPIHFVTAEDVAAGSYTFTVSRTDLGADGVHALVAGLVDLDGHAGNSPALPLTLDSVAPSAVSLTVSAGQDAVLNASETDVQLNVAYTGMAAGDVIALRLDGVALGSPHLVSAAEAAAGTVLLDVSKASLGTDGLKNVAAVVTDMAGNAGSSPMLALTVDTDGPSAVTLAVAAGEDALLNATESDVHLDVAYVGMAAGDVVQLTLGGVSLGGGHVVSAAEAAAGTLMLDVSRASLGADGVKNISATVTDTVGNQGTSALLSLTVDTAAPSSVSLAIAAGEDGFINASETDVHLNLGYAGMSVGDVVTLNVGNATLGTPHVVTAADVAAGTILLDISKASLGADGVKNVTATVTDAAGNMGTSPVLPLTLDTAAPSSVSLSVAAGEDGFLNANETDVHLNLGYAGMAVGDVVTLNLGNATLGPPHVVTAAEVAAGTILLDISKASLGADGVKNVTATVTDVAGNVGTSPVLPLTLDTSAPSAVTLALAAGEDGILNATETDVHLNLGYAGMAEGDVVTLNLGNATLGTPHVVTAADVAAGTILLDISKASLGADGVKNVTATVTDAAGNAGTSPVLPLTLDTTAPSTVSVAVAAGDDAHLGLGDSDVHLVVTYGGMTVGDVLRLTSNGSALGASYTVTTADVNAGRVTFDVLRTDLGADGTKNIVATATDAAGNVGTSPLLALTVDTLVSSPTLTLGAGESDQLGLATTDVHITVQAGTLAIGDVVQLQLAGSPLAPAHVVTLADIQAGGVTFDVTRASLGADGVKTVTATVTDLAHNVGTSPVLPLTVDTVAPSGVVLAVGAGDDSLLNALETGVHLTLGYAGMVAGDVVALNLGGIALGSPHVVTAAEATAGVVGFDVSKASLGFGGVNDGIKNITATATDAAGNSGTSPVLPLTVDTVAPSGIAVMVTQGQDAVLNAGESDVSLDVSYVGMAAGDVVALTLAGAPLGTSHIVSAAEASAGVVVLDVTRASLGIDGIKNIVATVTDLAGNAGSSAALPLTVDTVAPSSVSLAVAAGENAILNASETDVHLNLGYAGMVAGDVVTLNLAGSTIGTPYTVTAADVTAGRIVLDVSKADLGTDGIKNVTASVTDAAGNTGTSAVLPLTVDTTPPTSVTLAVASGENAILNASETEVHLNLGYAGMAAGDVVTLNLGNGALGLPYTVTAADVAAGTILLDVSKSDLGVDGVKNVTATVTDAAGNAGSSAILALTVDTVAPSSVNLALAPGNDAYLNAAESSVHLTLGYAGLAAGDVVVLNLGTSTLGSPYTVTAADVSAGRITLDVSKADLGFGGVNDGVKNITATVTDPAGNAGTSAVLQLTVDTGVPAPTLTTRPGEDAHVGFSETDVHLQVRYAGMAVGDSVVLDLGNGNHSATHVVTTIDLQAGSVTFDVSRASLGANGAKTVTAIATDLAGNVGTSASLPLTVDNLASAPSLSVGSGESTTLGLAANDVHVTVSYAGAAIGDTVQLMLDGVAFGSPYTVTLADSLVGGATFAISRASLGPDGQHVLVADVTATLNGGVSSPLPLMVDTVAPSAVTLAVGPGENALINASESDVHVAVGYAGMAIGDVIQLKLSGSVFGTPHAVTAADVTAGSVTFDVAKADLLSGVPGDGVKNLTAAVTDSAGNTGNSAVLALTVDTTAPSAVSLTVAPGEDAYLNAGETAVHLHVGYAGMVAGDVVAMNLGGSVIGTPYTVSAADVTAGFATVDVTKASLGADGVKNVVASITDAAGNTGTSAPLPLTVDTVAPTAVTLAIATGEDAVLNASEPDLHVNVGYAGMAAGDVVAINLGGSTVGTPHVVTAAEVTAGVIVLDVARASLGADGVKNIVATITDVAGNVGSSAILPLTVDTAAPAPSLAPAPGENAVVNAAENHLDVRVTDLTLQAGDVVRLTLDGNVLGASHIVTTADVTAGAVTFTIAKSDLGADGTHQLVAIATDAAGNVGSSAAMAVVLDTSLPQVAFSNGSASTMSSAGNAALGALHSGIVLVDGNSVVSDGGTVAIGSVALSLAGFVDGAAERLTIGGQTLNADGSNAPAAVTAAGLSWSVAFANNAYTFTALGGPASAAQTAALMQASYNDTASTLTDGQRVLTYVLTDAGGNPGNAVSASLLVATTPPGIVPTITSLGADTGIAGDFDTTVAAQTVYGTFTGQAQQGDTIQVSTDGTTWINATVYATGAWYANGVTLLAGTHDLWVRAIDAQGNARAPSSHAYTLDAAVITTTAHIDQVLDSASVNGSTTGPLTSGISTDDSAPTISGSLTATLAAGQVVGIYDTLNGVTTRLGEATVVGTAWTFAGVTLVAGENSLTAVVEKPASGAASVASNTFVIDEQTLPFGVYDHVGNVQGLLMQGGITDDAHATVSGTLGAAPLGANEVVAIYDGAVRLGNATLNGTTFSFSPVTALANGSHTLVAMIEDGTTGTATNGRVVGIPVQFTVDTTSLPPTQTVAITTASESTVTNGSISGGFASGTSTDGTTPTLAGTLSAALLANQDVAVFDTVDGVTTRLGTATVNGSTWSFATPALAVGSHNLTAAVENTATGVQGPSSASFNVIEQSVAITGLYDDVGINVGFILQNGITTDARPTVSGSLGAALGTGEAVVIYDGSNRLGIATIDSAGTTFTFTPTTLLLDGVHSLRAMVEDAATGTSTNARVVGSTMNFITVTSTSVPSETVTSFTATESATTNGSVAGTFASGTSTDGSTPTFAGTLSGTLGIGEALAIWDTVGGVATRIGFATTIGTAWTFTSPALAIGTHSISARVENAVFGSDGAFSSPFIVIEQSLTVTGLTDHVGPTQGLVAAGGLTDDARATFAGTLGTAALGSNEVVAIFDGTTKLGNATVNGTTWSFTPGTALVDGTHSLRAMIEDGSTGTSATGRVVGAAQTFTLNTSTVVPTQTATIAGVTEADNANGSLTGSFASGTSTDGRTPTLTGNLDATLGAGQVLAVYDGATRLGTATVAGTGWTYTTPALAVGTHSLTAVVENPASGAHGTASAAFVVNEQSLAIDSLLGLTGAINVLVGGLATVVVPTAPQLSGTLGTATLGANEVVAIYDGGTKLGNAVLNGNAWGFSTANAGLINGFHTVTAMIQDGSTTDPSLGRVVAQSTSFTVNLSLLVPTATPQITYGIESAAINGSKIGGFASGESIDSQTPTIGGTVNATLDVSQVLAVYDGAVKLGNATVVGQSWSFLTPTLAYGAHNLTAQVENVSTGSHGTASSAYVVKTQSLSAITVTDDIGAIRGTVVNGGVTDDIRPTFVGTLGAANILDLSLETVSIYDTYNGVRMKIGDAFVNGVTWSFTPSVLNLLFGMQDGVHSVNAVIEPLLSMTTADDRVVSASTTFTVDTTTTPTQLVGITSVTDSVSSGGSKAGVLGNGSTIDDTAPVFTGTISAALTGTQKVAVYDLVGITTTKLGYATVSATNPLQWTFQSATALVAGGHTLTADVENTASGSQGLMSGIFTITERPVTLHVTDDVGAIQGDVLAFGNGNVTDDTTVVLSGTIGTPLALGGALNLLESVQVYDNGVSKGAATVNGTDWSMTLSGLSQGTHNLVVNITPLLGLGGVTVATAASVTIQASDLLTLTSDPTYSTTALAAKYSLGGTGGTLDLTKLGGAGQPAQPHIDVIDVGATNGTVKLALADVLTGNVGAFTNANGWSGITFPASHQLVVDGSAGTVTMTDGAWSAAGTATHAGHTYNVYEDSTHLAQLLIESHLTRTGPIGG